MVETVSAFVLVVFLQGEEGYAMIDQIDALGADELATELDGYDFGGETDGNALANGDVYASIPEYDYERCLVAGPYTVRYAPWFGNVAVYRSAVLDADEVAFYGVRV